MQNKLYGWLWYFVQAAKHVTEGKIWCQGEEGVCGGGGGGGAVKVRTLVDKTAKKNQSGMHSYLKSIFPVDYPIFSKHFCRNVEEIKTCLSIAY